MDQLKIIAEQTKINGLDDIHRKEGCVPAVNEGCLAFDLGITFKVGDKPGKEGYCVKSDLARMAKSIYEAKFQADYIIVSIHCHETSGTDKSEPAMAQEELARLCVDNGADAVVVTIPICRGVWRYTRVSLFSILWAISLCRMKLCVYARRYVYQVRPDQQCNHARAVPCSLSGIHPRPYGPACDV